MPQLLHPPSPDRPGRWVPKANPDATGLRVRKDRKDLQARKVPRAFQAPRANPVLPDRLDLLAVRKHARWRRDNPVPPGRLDLKGPPAPRGLKDRKV
jgi:hypothetical protein